MPHQQGPDGRSAIFGGCLSLQVMLCLNLLTIQGPTIYNVSAVAVTLPCSERRRTLTVCRRWHSAGHWRDV